MRTPIIGGPNELRSPNAAASRLVNLYLEPTPDGKTSGYLTRCPGLSLVGAYGNGPIRGLHVLGAYGYVVSGNSFYQVNLNTLVGTLKGTVTGIGTVSIADNGVQIFIACNPDGFIYNTGTGVFAEITDGDFPGAVTVGYLDGYFIFNEPDSQKVWATSLLDGTAIDPLDFSSAEGSPDQVIGVSINHREAWFFGTDSIEIWYNAGLTSFPLERISGAFIEFGLRAAHSIAKLDNTTFWLGSEKNGDAAVYKAEGYQARRVSTTAVDVAIQGYSRIDDAVAFSYQQEGHAFYVLVFPTAGKTWSYDVSTGVWNERAGMVNGVMQQHAGTCISKWGRDLVVGDFASGNVYALSLSTYDDNGDPQKWIRAWRAVPTDANSLKNIIHHSLQIDIEAGVGLDGTPGVGTNPRVMLRWSDDGGHTWGNYHMREIGKIGEYKNRVIFRRLGKSRDRVYELSGTDPVKIAILGAEINAVGANS